MRKFWLNFSKLITGTLLGQSILIISLPFLTRLYSPNQFEMLATFMSLVAIVATIASLRYNVAIPIVRYERSSVALLILSILFSSLSTCIIILLISLYLMLDVDYFANIRFESSFLLLLCLAIFFTSCFNALQNWAIRKNLYSEIARIRFYRSTVGVISQIVLYFTPLGHLGLILGQLIMSVFGIFRLTHLFSKLDYSILKRTRVLHINFALRKYINYPKYSVMEALLNNSSTHIPIIIISIYGEGAIGGVLFLAMKLLGTPVSLVGTSVAQVYNGSAQKEYYAGNLAQFSFSVVLKVFKLFVPVLVLLTFILHLYGQNIFGENFSQVETIVLLILPWYVLQLLTSPISYSLHIMGALRTASCLQLIGALIRILPLVFLIHYDLKYFVEVYALTSAIFYLIYGIVVILHLRKQGLA